MEPPITVMHCPLPCEEECPGFKRMSLHQQFENLEAPSFKRVKIQNCSAAWDMDRVFRPIVEKHDVMPSAELSPFCFTSASGSFTALAMPKFCVKPIRPKVRCSSPTDEPAQDRPDSLLRRSLCPQPQAFE